MSGKRSQLYGRHFEAVWLRGKLFPPRTLQTSSPIILLYGVPGSGKTTLWERLFLFTEEERQQYPMLVFSCFQPKGNMALAEFATAVMASAQSNLPELQRSMQLLRQGFTETLMGVSNTDRVAIEAYKQDGSTRPVSVVDVNPDRDGLVLAQSFTAALESWFSEFQFEEVSNGSIRMIFIFDDFPGYSPSVKRWLGDPFFSALTGRGTLPSTSILLTGEDSWEVGSQADYWRAHPGSFSQLEIGPLARGDCLRWLEAEKVNPEWVDIILEETEALPGRIQKLLLDRKSLEIRVKEANVGKDWTIPLGPRERRWLHAAAMAERTTLESMQVLLGHEDAKEALHWLMHVCPLDSIRKGKFEGEQCVFLSAQAREQILKVVVSKVPSRHREFLEKVELFTKVTTKVPSLSSRTQLRKLAPVQPFSLEIIRELFDGDEEANE